MVSHNNGQHSTCRTGCTRDIKCAPTGPDRTFSSSTCLRQPVQTCLRDSLCRQGVFLRSTTVGSTARALLPSAAAALLVCNREEYAVYQITKIPGIPTTYFPSHWFSKGGFYKTIKQAISGLNLSPDEHKDDTPPAPSTPTTRLKERTWMAFTRRSASRVAVQYCLATLLACCTLCCCPVVAPLSEPSIAI